MIQYFRQDGQDMDEEGQFGIQFTMQLSTNLHITPLGGGMATRFELQQGTTYLTTGTGQARKGCRRCIAGSGTRRWSGGGGGGGWRWGGWVVGTGRGGGSDTKLAPGQQSLDGMLVNSVVGVCGIRIGIVVLAAAIRRRRSSIVIANGFVVFGQEFLQIVRGQGGFARATLARNQNQLFGWRGGSVHEGLKTRLEALQFHGSTLNAQGFEIQCSTVGAAAGGERVGGMTGTRAVAPGRIGCRGGTRHRGRRLTGQCMFFGKQLKFATQITAFRVDITFILLVVLLILLFLLLIFDNVFHAILVVVVVVVFLIVVGHGGRQGHW